MADTIEKKIVEAPSLPTTVQGDGRYLMSILKKYLEESSTQINLANGYSASDLKNNGDSGTPQDFIVDFNRNGVLFTWKHLADITSLAYYELRTNTNVGSTVGLLDRTYDNQSTNALVSYVDTVYLYAIYKNATYGTPATLTYTKPRPDTPTDIALTKNNEGTLITFLDIPSNCIGANIYINGVKYSTTDNIYLFKHEPTYRIKVVEVAYYDSFGEGERGILYCVLPDITGFLVERNGSILDFYWDVLNIYNVQYSVRVNQTPEWESGMEIFRTKLNKKSYIYPNTGGHYFLIKAVDEHNNTSENAVYFYADHDIEINKNIILNFKQLDVAYNGNKINCYYDAVSQGLRLEKSALTAEYLIAVNLPQKYKARNWLNMDVQGVSNNSSTWDDCNFTWDSKEANTLSWSGKISDLTGVVVQKQIAISAVEASSLALMTLENTVTAETGQVPFENIGTDTYASGRWANGLKIKDTTRLAYDVEGTSNFHIVFWLKKESDLPDTVLMTIANANGTGLYEIGYSSYDSSFYLKASDNKEIKLKTVMQERDWIMLGISQGASKRSFFIKDLGFNSTDSGTIEASPCGILGKIYCYPKILI